MKTRIITEEETLYESENDFHIAEGMVVNEEPITADNFFDRVSTWVKNMKVFNS